MDYREEALGQQTGPPKSEKELLVFILGILSIVTCALLGPIALMMGAEDRDRIRAGTLAKSDLFSIGYILAYVGTAILVVQGLVFCAMILFMIFAVH